MKIHGDMNKYQPKLIMAGNSVQASLVISDMTGFFQSE